MHSKVIVTGAAGFLGRYIAQAFDAAGWYVIGIDVLAQELASCKSVSEYRQFDLARPDLSGMIFGFKPKLIVHAAGSASVPLSLKQPGLDFEANVLTTARLLDAARICPQQPRVILLSSAAVYGTPLKLPITENTEAKPISPYGYHKFMAETLCREYAETYQMRTASARVFSAYGAGLRRQVLWDICVKLSSGQNLVLQGNGTESRDFVHASDVANALLMIAERGDLKGESYNVATGVESPISRLAELLTRAFGADSGLTYTGALPPGTPVRWCADIARIKSLGFNPGYTLETGAQEYATWFKNTRKDS